MSKFKQLFFCFCLDFLLDYFLGFLGFVKSIVIGQSEKEETGLIDSG